MEPFAGAAGYASRHHHKQVILVDLDPDVCAIWKWLIGASRRDVLSLPLDATNPSTLDLPLGAKLLIGKWLSPMGDPKLLKKEITKSALQWVKTHPHVAWSQIIRSRIANQVECIKHWCVLQGDFSLASETVKEHATWFVDPPYIKEGKVYKKSSAHINFSALGDWCQSLPGQVIVCESKGADWLPFHPLASIHRADRTGNKKGKGHEVVWLSDGNYRSVPQGFLLT